MFGYRNSIMMNIKWHLYSQEQPNKNCNCVIVQRIDGKDLYDICRYYLEGETIIPDRYNNPVVSGYVRETVATKNGFFSISKEEPDKCFIMENVKLWAELDEIGIIYDALKINY